MAFRSCKLVVVSYRGAGIEVNYATITTHPCGRFDGVGGRCRGEGAFHIRCDCRGSPDLTRDIEEKKTIKMEFRTRH